MRGSPAGPASVSSGFRAAGGRPEIREIVFFYTPDFASTATLHPAPAHRLRDGFPVGDPEIVCKYRHPGRPRRFRRRHAAADRRAVPDEVQGRGAAAQGRGRRLPHPLFRTIASSASASSVAAAALPWRPSPVFQPLPGASRNFTAEKVTLVSRGIVELLLPLGTLDFGKGLAKCDIGLWRTRGEHQPLVGEFAFRAVVRRQGQGRREAEGARRRLLCRAAARRRSLARAWRHQDRDGLPPERHPPQSHE